jgi:hypothetical protein
MFICNAIKTNGHDKLKSIMKEKTGFKTFVLLIETSTIINKN